MKLNNKGLSLVEMIIVIAIISIFTVMFSMGVGVLTSKPADECAEKFASTLRNVRVSTMGKKSTQVVLKQESVGAPIYMIEIVNGSTKTPVRVGEKNITCTFLVSGDTTPKDLSSYGSSGIQLSFDRTTGGFNEVDVGGGTMKYINTFYFEKGTKKAEVSLAHLTGKVTVK